jgi:hypothetical protein
MTAFGTATPIDKSNLLQNLSGRRGSMCPMLKQSGWSATSADGFGS